MPTTPLIDGPAIAPDFAQDTVAQPQLTIGVPAYNRPRLLQDALASIAAQAGGCAYEVVVSDDGGLPETRDIVAGAGLRAVRYYVNRPALGPVRNWNRCIELARAPWVTILHEDDLLYPWFLRTVKERLRPGIAAVSVRCVQGSKPPPLSTPESVADARQYPPAWFLKASTTPFPGVVFRRDLAFQLGGFDPRQEGLADYAFWYDLARAGGIETIRTPAAFYRVNEGQWTERAWPTMLRRAHLLRLRIAREQLGDRPKLGRWIARFYTTRMARAYGRRFAERPAILGRAQQFERIPFSWVSSGWVWRMLKTIAR